MPAPFIPSVTRTDLRLARLPTGIGRERLRRLARHGAAICHDWGFGTLAEICDSLGLALNELSHAERELATARVQLGKLQQENARLRAEGFDVPTTTQDTRDLLPLTARTGTIDAQNEGSP